MSGIDSDRREAAWVAARQRLPLLAEVGWSGGLIGAATDARGRPHEFYCSDASELPEAEFLTAARNWGFWLDTPDYHDGTSWSLHCRQGLV
ncbi:MAG: hypothetical protein GY925_15330 [Actinomycetia bacterium]|nr:hypothetical protein [Actinomycetes bacterium]